MKKCLRFLFSMQFALILLAVLVAVCVAGSVVPQGEDASYYLSNYSESTAGLILAIGLNDTFHCGWFIALTLILCLNLLGCNIVRFPALVKRTKDGFTAEKFRRTCTGGALFVSSDPKSLFEKSGFHRLTGTDAEIYGVKFKAGIWGAWLCHLGMLVVIIGFGLGQMLQLQYAVYGVPGQTKPVADTRYELTINDFEIALREDDTVEQYTADITVTDTETGETGTGKTSVNSPLSLFGMRFYQNSTGWAANVQVWKENELIQEDVLCAGEYMKVRDKDGLTVMFSAFYPDFVMGPEGTPMTMSSRLNNPAYLYRLYYNNELLGMNVLKANEMITVDKYAIIFTDPQSYTLIQIKKDPFTWLAAIGALMVMIALILAFYLRTAEVMAVRREDGDWNIYGRSRKGDADFIDMLRSNHEQLGGKLSPMEGEEK